MITTAQLPEPGLLIGGKFRVNRTIGCGGMATVYAATDQTLGRQVAIKVLSPGLMGDPSSYMRFEHEARVARHLQHPNTIQIFDFRSLDNGLPYIVMEYLRGAPLDELIQAEGALHPDRVLDIARQVLASLQNAHENRVLHRDLKPRNVLVGEFGGQSDFAKVLDFGLSKVLDFKGNGQTLQTRSGVILGTPEYISPERLRGEDLGPASDLFSFGMMLCEMLAGQSPYAGLAPLQILSNIVDDAPVPVPKRVRDGRLGGVVLRATEKNTAGRYQSARAVIEDLDLLESLSKEKTLKATDLHKFRSLVEKERASRHIRTQPIPNLQTASLTSEEAPKFTDTVKMKAMGPVMSGCSKGRSTRLNMLVFVLIGFLMLGTAALFFALFLR